MTSITVHHLEQSRSLRILWLLEELGATYDLVTYLRDPRTFRAPPELLQVHPLGKSPVVELDGEVVAESGAMVETLLEQLDGGAALRPEPGSDAFKHYRFFLHYAEGSLMSPLLVSLISQRVRNAPVPFFLKPVVKRIASQVYRGYPGPELERHGRFLDAHLAQHDWFAGSTFSAADVLMSYPVEAGLERGFPEDVPRLRRWLAECQARPAYVRAAERAEASERAAQAR